MAIEAVSAYKAGPYQYVVIWLREPHGATCWDVVIPSGEIIPDGNEGPDAAQRAVLQAAFEDWKQLGDWDDGIPRLTRALLKSPGGRQRSEEMARQEAAQKAGKPDSHVSW